MANSFVQTIYENWIKKNCDRFRYQPYITKSSETSFSLQFIGIASEITFYIADNGIASLFIYDSNGIYWDIIAEFDVYECITPKGKYYCSLCLKPNYFLSRQELWEQHVFEELLNWTNKNFVRDNYICLWGMPEETSWGATIAEWNSIKSEDWVTVFPVVI